MLQGEDTYAVSYQSCEGRVQWWIDVQYPTFGGSKCLWADPVGIL